MIQANRGERSAVGEQQDRYHEEVSRGARFEFGKNWTRFLRVVDDERIAIAERSLKGMLKTDRLDGKSFLDVGSGSGLFSLAARRSGAQVHSFDYDPQSVACTLELKRRFFPGDANWTVERGSVLDRAYLDKLGTFDIVYSWGVLHHTGQMWQALDNIKPLVRMGGQLFIAIYNDQGEVTDRWAGVKQKYNSLSKSAAALYALGVVAREESKALIHHLRGGGPGAWVRSWTEYSRQSTRGMSRLHDWIDWIGGQPYERATIEQIVDCFAKDGFRLANMFDCSKGYGCNEFVFSRDAPLGTLIESPIPGGSSLVRRYGRRVMGPFERMEAGWLGLLSNSLTIPEGSSRLLFKNGNLVGPVSAADTNSINVGSPDESAAAIEAATFSVVIGTLHRPQNPFALGRGRMWSWKVSELAGMADNSDAPSRSSLFVFENGQQLPMPHSLHDDIAKTGKGRFSHWGDYVYFAPLSLADPNADPGRYAIVVPSESIEDVVIEQRRLKKLG
jgi:2-polyprenyl-3-methyl-5-hydroxy-6-metoxy-1,4-benzoquinol methylase